MHVPTCSTRTKIVQCHVCMHPPLHVHPDHTL